MSGERDAALEDPGRGGGAAQGAVDDRPTKSNSRETAAGPGKQKQRQGEVKVLRSCHKRRDQVCRTCVLCVFVVTETRG